MTNIVQVNIVSTEQRQFTLCKHKQHAVSGKKLNKNNNLHLILISHWLYIKKKRNICNHIFHWL